MPTHVSIVCSQPSKCHLLFINYPTLFNPGCQFCPRYWTCFQSVSLQLTRSKRGCFFQNTPTFIAFPYSSLSFIVKAVSVSAFDLQQTSCIQTEGQWAVCSSIITVSCDIRFNLKQVICLYYTSMKNVLYVQQTQHMLTLALPIMSPGLCQCNHRKPDNVTVLKINHITNGCSCFSADCTQTELNGKQNVQRAAQFFALKSCFILSLLVLYALSPPRHSAWLMLKS